VREEIIAAAVESVTRAVVDALARGELPTADALRLLLRAYAATGRDDVRGALEAGLADALEIAADSSSASAPRWLILFAEAADASDDDRLRGAVPDLASKTRMTWRATRSVGDAAVSVDACLRANLDVQAAIDELERTVAAAYEPGEGIEGSMQDEVSMAGALLTAFGMTDRLPYAMLAEELIQHTRRIALEQADLPFETACDLATVFSRMAALHANDEYRTAAVLAPDAQYADDAALILERLAGEAVGRGLAGAAYGLAAGEWRASAESVPPR
jgi:hypothetical protein